jgi:hypothetical protein
MAMAMQYLVVVTNFAGLVRDLDAQLLYTKENLKKELLMQYFGLMFVWDLQ